MKSYDKVLFSLQGNLFNYQLLKFFFVLFESRISDGKKVFFCSRQKCDCR